MSCTVHVNRQSVAGRVLSGKGRGLYKGDISSLVGFCLNAREEIQFVFIKKGTFPSRISPLPPKKLQAEP
jgi:hypothetical protein